MPLIKKEYIHEGNLRHLGQGMEGVSEQIARDNAQLAEGYSLTEEEYQEKYNQLVSKAQEDSSQMHDKAEEEARTIIDSANKQASDILEKEKGRGFEIGRKEALQQLQDNIKESQNIIKQANDQKNSIIKSAVPEILKLAIKVSAAVIKAEITQNDDIVMNIIRDAIEKISDNEQVVIKVSQHDLQNVRNNKELIIDLVEAKNLSIVADKHTNEGGCVIETKLGYIDARVSTKLEMIENALLAVYTEEKVKKETHLKEKHDRGEDVDFNWEEQKDINELMGIETKEKDTPKNEVPENETESISLNEDSAGSHQDELVDEELSLEDNSNDSEEISLDGDSLSGGEEISLDSDNDLELSDDDLEDLGDDDNP